MSLHFEPIWPWPLMLAACVAMLAVVALAYPRRIQQLPPVTRISLSGLRLLSAFLILLLMLRPVAQLRSQDRSDSALYVLTDISPSMQTTDTPGGVSRRKAVLETLAAAAPSLQALAGRTEIRYRDFSDTLQVVAQPEDGVAGRMTAFGKALEQLSEDAGRTRVAGVIVLSDGRQAASGSLDIDPLKPARLLGRQQRPLYPVVYGSAESSDAGLDLALEELDVSRDVFRGNVLPVRVKLKSAGAQGQPVRVRVLLEDRSQVLPGVSGIMRPVDRSTSNRSVVTHTPGGAAEDVVLSLQIVPDREGELKLAIEADPLPGEIRKTNNRVETIIRVRQGGIRVAYFDILRAEQSFLRGINRSSRIQLDFQLIRSGSFADRNQIDDKYFVPGNYDAYIIGNVPASAFQPRQLAALQQCCLQGAGLMMTGGFNNFGAGGYDKSPLARLLPVEMNPADAQLTDPQQMRPTRDGLSHFVMQIAPPDQNRSRWDQLPPLSGANLLRRREISGAQVLAVSPQGAPLLIGQSIGISRVLAFAGDTTWQWAMKGFAEEHQRFWRQVIFWLTRKELDSESPVWLAVEPRDLAQGQPAELTFGARRPDGTPNLAAEYELEVTLPQGRVVPVVPRRVAEGGAADFTDTTEPGDYWVRLKAAEGGEAIAGTAITRFSVSTRDPELDSPAADPVLLRELAHLSGGALLTRDELLQRLEDWAQNGVPGTELDRTARLTLWDNWLSLLLFVLLLSIEWVIRKRRGLV